MNPDKRDVTVLIGAGSIGLAIARRVSAGKRVLLADLRQDNVDSAAQVLGDAGFDVSTAIVDVSSRRPSTRSSGRRRRSAASPVSFTPPASLPRRPRLLPS